MNRFCINKYVGIVILTVICLTSFIYLTAKLSSVKLSTNSRAGAYAGCSVGIPQLLKCNPQTQKDYGSYMGRNILYRHCCSSIDDICNTNSGSGTNYCLTGDIKCKPPYNVNDKICGVSSNFKCCVKEAPVNKICSDSGSPRDYCNSTIVNICLDGFKIDKTTQCNQAGFGHIYCCRAK